MTEINTFSALIDDCIRRTGRPNLKNDMVSYARQTMRECQVKGLFSRDLTEDSITTTATPHIWDRPVNFRMFKTSGIRYQIFNARDQYIYPKMVSPGKAQREEDYYWYAGADYVVFSGIETGTIVDIAYLSYFKKLAYYAAAVRPATYSLEDETWSYLTAATDADKLIARNQVTNWMLTDWYDVVLEGTCAKVYKSSGDPRAVSSFALFKSLQADLVNDETVQSYSE